MGSLAVLLDLQFLIGLIVGAAVALVHIGFAMHVWRDAGALEFEQRLIFGPAGLWALAVLVSGVVGALAYWLINRSTLRPDS